MSDENQSQTPPPAPTETKPPTPPKPRKPRTEPLTVDSALNAASAALASAVRCARLNHIGDQASINILETEFENAKNAVASGKAAIGQLETAVNALKLGKDLLSNHSLKDATDLRAVRNAHDDAVSAVNVLKTAG